MIDAYLDESGIHESAKACLIAGYWGGPGQMKRLDKTWKETLARFDFPMQEFHAKDLIKKRDMRPMLEALAKTTGQQRKVYPVAYGIVVDDFKSFNHDERRFMTGSTLMESGKLVTSGCPGKPYFSPFQNIVKIVTDAAPVGGKARFFFGLNKPFAEYALAMFEQVKKQASMKRAANSWHSRDRLGEAAFPQAEETGPLQAADLFVHSTYLHMCEAIARGESGDFTKAPTGLARLCIGNLRDPSDLVYQNKECLQKMIDQAKSLCPAWAPA
jgi:hypothetical protein